MIWKRGTSYFDFDLLFRETLEIFNIDKNEFSNIYSQTASDHRISTPKRCALKRLFVNNDKDLAVCKREIAIVVSYINLFVADTGIKLAFCRCHSILSIYSYLF